MASLKVEGLTSLSHHPQIIKGTEENRTHIFSFVQNEFQLLEQIKGYQNYICVLFDQVNCIGSDYVSQAIDRLKTSRLNFDEKGDEIQRTIETRNYGALENKPQPYQIAINIGREKEAIKRYLLTQEILANEHWFDVEKILLLGGLTLAHQSDIIFFDEWRPKVKDSEIAKKLREMEENEEGSSLTVLPGIPSNTRWFTREIIDYKKPLAKDNIKLIPYRESLPTAPELIKTLNTMVSLLKQEKAKGSDDFGYIEFLRAWSSCLTEGNLENQKQLEDEMMIAWRKINPNAPVFMVPWAEYLDDPSSILVNPSFRLGVADNTEEALSSEKEEEKIRKLIIKYIRENNIDGLEAVEASTSIHAVWTGYAGFDLTLGITSQVLPNDTDLRRNHGVFVLPDSSQYKRSAPNRERLAKKIYPPEILQQINNLRLSDPEVFTNEMAAHEFFHPVGVTKKGEDALGKVREHFEEAKSTFGGLLVQGQEKGLEFQKKALATLLHSAPRYLSLDGNSSNQGYANKSRVDLTAAEKLGIISYEESSGFKLNINDDNTRLFWLEMARYVKWCTGAYKDEVFSHLGDQTWEERINQQRQRYKKELDEWIGIKQVEGEQRVYNQVINEIKKRLKSS